MIAVMKRRLRMFPRLMLALSLLAAAPQVPLRADEPVKQDMKQAGKDLGRAGKAAGDKLSDSAKKVGHETAQGSETVWQKTKRTSHHFWCWLTGKKEKKD
jgi:hypothetical protein